MGEKKNGGMGERVKGRISSYKDLDVFQSSMDLAMEIYELTKRFPREEQYALTDQIRKSSRSVSANIAEAWRKRRYEAAFISKLSDAETEACETQVWVEFALRLKYTTQSCALRFDQSYDRIIAQIVTMIDQPEKWIIGK